MISSGIERFPITPLLITAVLHGLTSSGKDPIGGESSEIRRLSITGGSREKACISLCWMPILLEWVP